MRIDKHNIHKYIDGTTLDFSRTGVTSIEDIPDHITFIYCYSNNLTSLPKLPSGLKYLYCWNNNLTSLPYLPDSLVYLDCMNNKLTSHPIDPRDKQWWMNHNKLLNRSTIIENLISKQDK